MMSKFDTQIQLLSGQWHQLTNRDRLVLKGLFLVLIVSAFIVLLWRPILEYRESSKALYLSELELLTVLNSQSVSSLKGQRKTSSRQQSLISLVTQSSQRRKLTVTRYEPKKNNAIRVLLESVEYNPLMLWLESLRTQHDLKITNITIEQTSTPGVVRVNVVLER